LVIWNQTIKINKQVALIQRDIQSLLLDIERNRQLTGQPMPQQMEGTGDPEIFQTLLNQVQNRTNG
jgi:hypothetical protein